LEKNGKGKSLFSVTLNRDFDGVTPNSRKKERKENERIREGEGKSQRE